MRARARVYVCVNDEIFTGIKGFPQVNFIWNWGYGIFAIYKGSIYCIYRLRLLPGLQINFFPEINLLINISSNNSSKVWMLDVSNFHCTHWRQFVKLIVYLEKVQVAIAKYRFRLRNFVLEILALKMNHVENPNPRYMVYDAKTKSLMCQNGL